MVCIPCIVIPLVLWVLRLLQPYLMPYLPEGVQNWFKYNMKAYGPKDKSVDDSSEEKASCPLKGSNSTTEKNGHVQNGHVQNGHAAEIPCGPDKKSD